MSSDFWRQWQALSTLGPFPWSPGAHPTINAGSRGQVSPCSPTPPNVLRRPCESSPPLLQAGDCAAGSSFRDGLRGRGGFRQLSARAFRRTLQAAVAIRERRNGSTRFRASPALGAGARADAAGGTRRRGLESPHGGTGSAAPDVVGQLVRCGGRVYLSDPSGRGRAALRRKRSSTSTTCGSSAPKRLTDAPPTATLSATRYPPA